MLKLISKIDIVSQALGYVSYMLGKEYLYRIRLSYRAHRSFAHGQHHKKYLAHAVCFTVRVPHPRYIMQNTRSIKQFFAPILIQSLRQDELCGGDILLEELYCLGWVDGA